ncbi:hypothetical protein [Desulfosporosinus sp. SB140]|uniref:hypothetical protein n=1 Tax=Desulfosporosinus paludis TaxID=3115649 RepID=UPI00388F106F
MSRTDCDQQSCPGNYKSFAASTGKMYGGNPLGFASWRAVHCPWAISRDQWDDFLAYSRLQAFDILEELVLNSKRF